VERLRRHDIDVRAEEVFTSVLAGAQWLRRRSIRVVAPYVAEEALADLAEFTLVGGMSRRTGADAPQAVVVGDLGESWSHALLNEAFRHVMNGAQFVALQRGRYWLGPTGLEVDAGAYVAALEYATEKQAVVCGKPNTEFFLGAVASLKGEDLAAAAAADGTRRGGPSRQPDRVPGVVMVGDDLWSDVYGAQQAGLGGWLVRTGKFRTDVLAESDVRPDRVIESVAELVD
jgi:ribonucleotide monophosphatase NagD (HAD superfamily)